MPGIFGAWKASGKQNIVLVMENMIRAMMREDVIIDRFSDPVRGYCLGRASLGILNALAQPVGSSHGECRIIFHGELYGSKKAERDPDFILQQYMEKGDRCVEDLNGVFHFAVLDNGLGTIKLFTDKFGLQPLYYSICADSFLFSGEIRALLAEDSVSRKPDYTSIADFFHFGQILGDKTPLCEVRLVPSGSVLSLDMQSKSFSIKKYWDLERLFLKKGAKDEGISSQEVVAALKRAIQMRSLDRDSLALSLSAGLDSRALLAGLGPQAQGLRTYTLGQAGCADQKLAEQMARKAGTRHKFIELNDTYIDKFETMAAQMIYLSDGMFHPHESTEMLALDYFKQGDFKILLRGHGGELAKAALAYPVMVRPELQNCTNSRDSLDYIYRITDRILQGAEINRLFAPSFQEYMQEAPRQSLQESCGHAASNFSPADLCIFYYISQHIRRDVVASLEIFRTQIDIRLPYLDEDFVSKLLHLPIEQRNHGEIQFQLIRQAMPELIKIPNSNTGAPLDAGPLRLFMADKMQMLLKRLRIRGFRHYTEFLRWHREGFSESTRRILFSETSASRGLFDMQYLQSIFDRHVAGKSNYGRLLGTAVGIELWFRTFIDESPA